MKRKSAFFLVVLGLALAAGGCSTTAPGDYAATLSKKDRKYQSAACRRARAAAAQQAAEQDKTMSVAEGLMFGPYGVGMALAGKEHQEKKRRLAAREVHLRCSSQPLPAALRTDADRASG